MSTSEVVIDILLASNGQNETFNVELARLTSTLSERAYALYFCQDDARYLLNAVYAVTPKAKELNRESFYGLTKSHYEFQPTKIVSRQLRPRLLWPENSWRNIRKKIIDLDNATPVRLDVLVALAYPESLKLLVKEITAGSSFENVDTSGLAPYDAVSLYFDHQSHLMAVDMYRQPIFA